MQCLRIRGGFVFLCTGLICLSASGQNLVWKDSAVVYTLARPADTCISLLRFRLDQELEYTLSCTADLFSNWHQGNNTNLGSLFHHLRYHAQFANNRNVKIINSFIHDLGIQYFFDSTSRFQPDENMLDTRFEARIAKNLSLTGSSNLATRLFNSYQYVAGQNGTLLRTLSSSFLTPLLWTFSTGLGWTVPGAGNLSLGLVSAKFTWIRNREVYDQQKVTMFYGVPKDRDHIFEYGFSVHVQVDKDFLNCVHWYCDLLIFKNYRKPVDLVMKNLIGIRINRFLKTSIQTKLYYEKDVNRDLQSENLVALGFFVNL